MSAWPDDLRQALERGLFCPLELDDFEDIPNVGDIKEKCVPYIRRLRESQNEALLEEMPDLATPRVLLASQQDLDLRRASCPCSSGR